MTTLPVLHIHTVTTTTTGQIVAESLWTKTTTDPVAAYTLALLTGALVATAILQWKLIGDQMKLAREEFNATHRPKLAASEFMFSDVAPVSLKFSLRVRNIGDSPAFLTEHRTAYRTAPLANLMFKGLISWPVTHIVAADILLLPGQTGYLATEPWGDDADVAEYAVRTGQVGCIFVGRLTYKDNAGIERQLGFCRRYDFGTDRFVAMNDPEHEYAD